MSPEYLVCQESLAHLEDQLVLLDLLVLLRRHQLARSGQLHLLLRDQLARLVRCNQLRLEDRVVPQTVLLRREHLWALLYQAVLYSRLVLLGLLIRRLWDLFRLFHLLHQLPPIRWDLWDL